MALPGLLRFGPLTLCFLVLACVPHQARASSRGSLARKYVPINHSSDDGICVSSVTTKDGYILSLQRIPQGRAEVSGNGNNQPVIIQHGVTVDGMTWFLNSPEQNLPLILADNGFDVWIVNTRGTRYSRRHISLDPSNPAFWNWSWDELVTYELPAVFDYVFSQTGQKINYVGHSLGTLTALASFSEGKLVNQVKSTALLSPVAYLSYMKTALGVFAAKSFLGEIVAAFGLAEFDPAGLPALNFIKDLCTYPGVDCRDLLTAITGKNCCLNTTTLGQLLRNAPQATSTKNMVHMAQTVRSGVLAKFDYVRPGYNFMHYGKVSPPVYNLSNIPRNLPLFISYGGQDALSDVIDVEHLLDILKFHDVDKLSVQFVKDYGHVDFIMAVNAKDIVYNAILAFFKRQ